MCSAELSCPNKHAEIWTLCHFSFGVFQYLKSPFKEVVPGTAVNINICRSFIPALLIQLFILAASEIFVFKELVILSRLFLLAGLGMTLRAGAATACETAGVHRGP